MREKKMKENQSVGTAVYQPVSALNNPNYQKICYLSSTRLVPIRLPRKSSTFPCWLLQLLPPPPMIANLHLFFLFPPSVCRSFSVFPFFSSLPVPTSLQCCNHPSGLFSECGRSSSICAAVPPYSKASCLPFLVTLEW